MAKIRIALADTDELYLNKLADYFMEKANQFSACFFSAKESFAKYILDCQNSNCNDKADIIVFSEDFVDDTLLTADFTAKILFTDNSFSNISGFDIVNKYQKTELLVNALLLIYAEKTGHLEALKNSGKITKIIGVYSPVGGCGKTTIALMLAMLLADSEKRVFYLNYEIINSTAYFLNTAPHGSLTDVLLSLKTKGANTGLRLLANVFTDNRTKISFINPAESALEINELTLAEQIKLFQALVELYEFDYIVTDFDSGFPHFKQDLLQCCDFILMPTTLEKTSLSKISLLLKELTMRPELEELFSKIYLAANKADNQLIGNLQSCGILDIKPLEFAIPLSPTLKEPENIPLLLDSMRPIFRDFMAKVVLS